jgi:hypothetical protein
MDRENDGLKGFTMHGNEYSRSKSSKYNVGKISGQKFLKEVNEGIEWT